MSEIDKAREAYKLWWDTSPVPVPTACTAYIGALEAEITSLRSQLEEARENAFEEAAKVAENTAYEGIHESMWRSKFTAVAAAIRRLTVAKKDRDYA